MTQSDYTRLADRLEEIAITAITWAEVQAATDRAIAQGLPAELAAQALNNAREFQAFMSATDLGEVTQ